MAHAPPAESVGEYHLHTYFFQNNEASRAEMLAFRCASLSICTDPALPDACRGTSVLPNPFMCICLSILEDP